MIKLMVVRNQTSNSKRDIDGEGEGHIFMKPDKIKDLRSVIGLKESMLPFVIDQRKTYGGESSDNRPTKQIIVGDIWVPVRAMNIKITLNEANRIQ